MKFKLEIELGNDKMCDRYHVGDRLIHVASDVLAKGIKVGTEGRIMDLNGNTVGAWKVEDA